MLVVCALAPAVTAAAEPAREDLPEELAGELVEEIEVKGKRPTRVDALEVREVRETPARDLAEALEQQLGLGKVRKGGIANDLLVRGMKKDDVAVVVDGAHVHGACPSRMDPPSFHLDYAEVDRVMVKRGPFDVTQPGGLGGVVEVHTRGAPGAGPGGEVNLGYGEDGAMETSAVGSWGWERADLLVGGSFKQASPYVTGGGENFTALVPATAPARFRSTEGDQTAYDVRTGWAKVAARPADGQRVELGYTHQSGTDVLYPYLLMDGVTDDTDRVNLTWTADGAGPLSRALAQAYFSRVEHGMDDRERCSSALDAATCSGALPRAWSMRTLARSSVWGGKLEAGLGGPEAAVDALVGADFYVRRWDNTTTRLVRTTMTYADEASIPDVTIADVGLFAQAKRALGAGVDLTLGARLDVARTDAGGDRTPLYAVFHGGALPREQTDVLVSGNVQLDWAVGRGGSLFLGYGHGARVPDPQERYIALSGMMGRPWWSGDPSLRPVQSDEVDLGARWSARGLLVKAQAFHAWLTDYVVLAPASGVAPGGATVSARTYRNVSARTIGGEASARVALPLRLFASAGLTYVRGENLSDDVPLAELPPLRANLALRFDTGTFFVEAEEQLAARQERVDPALEEHATPGWAITNLRAGAEWGRVKLAAGVRNAFDEAYAEHLSYLRDPFAAGVTVPEPGRTWYSSLQVGF
jgi:iron complex outermembrane receptor protein